ncbi:MAG TPA: exopolysaccharide biosynthesis protein [Hyphomonas sp.]|nr:exopolysaccharide biosynthesis protein [Hyphomonas sp.]MCA8904112.1 exopolysaccharide biosynthesis protein [Hyphomonas sp.]MCB9970606.1 exopolysaccharide biosynthesis protein [Hyphomonas sp.]HPE47310.1 exopolysaccharide biosynthesis protein [Hyphomonas sp.]
MTQTTATAPGPDRTLLQTIEEMANGAPEQGYTLREILDQLDESAFGAGLFLLALPCCIPFLYGVPQVVALPMMALAIQMMLGREQPWLPSKLAARTIDKAGLVDTAKGGRKWLGWVEIFSRPRLTFLTGPRSERIVGAFLVFFCSSILVPLPLTNTTPGIAVALAAFGLINRDGLLVVLGCLLGFVWVSALLVLGPTALLAAVHLGKDWLTGLIS